MPDFADEIAKLLPVKDIYENAAQPTVRQVGAIGGDLMKVLHLVLAPVQYVAALQDRYRTFIDRSVRKVPEERRIQPAPQIAGPVLEGIRYEPEGTEIEEMFANLLANAMDKQNIGRAHPAYPNIIKQLSKDEAILLIDLSKDHFVKIIEANVKYTNQKGISEKRPINRKIVKDTFPSSMLVMPERRDFYINHLEIIGLLTIHTSKEERKPGIRSIRLQGSSRYTEYYGLTTIGKDFIAACQPPVN